jgi:hypothetical protein
MRLFSRIHVTSVLVVMLLLGAHAGAAAQSVQPTAAQLQGWQDELSILTAPASGGCFTAEYPRQTWQETTCAKAPAIPMPPKPGPRPMIIGNGNDISAMAPSGHIYDAVGSFDSVIGVVSESSPLGNAGPPVADAYTLQVNTNYMPTPACAGSPNPGCLGWQQFIFANDPTWMSFALIQYWLLQYNAPCPAGWTTFMFTGVPDVYCYQNSTAITIPNEPIINLANLRLRGNFSGTSDAVLFFDGPTAYLNFGTNAISAAGGWTIAEFNVFGYGGNSNGGSMATFNAGASAVVRTRINYGTPGTGIAPPICVAQGFTGETNNLNFGTPAPIATPPWPSLVFLENTAGGATTNCMAASVIGDTHEYTVAGTAYDFQATGDFVEAQVGTDFEVQTRKISGAPTWPAASVNQSVATRMGNTKVAMCDGKQLVVDGRTAELQPGGVLALPSGVTIHRTGNVYIIVDSSGNSVKVTVNSGYTDVDVGLGTWPVAVRGLLGNPGADPNKLEAKDGTVFDVPLTFDQLYRMFGDSWRVSPLRTLLSPCAQVASGNPATPFFAKDLNPDIGQRAQGICLQAKVTQEWLDFCVLDVAVIGDKAAKVYVGMQPPVVNGNP